MDRRDRITYVCLFGLILIGITAFVIWLFQNYELVDEEIRTSMSKEARRNPFLAAELFLRESGVDVESVSGRNRLHELPSTRDILFVNNFGPNLSPPRHTALINWIESGGHLITTANKTWNAEKEESGDQLLDELGVRLYSRYRNYDDVDWLDDDWENNTIDSSDHSPVEVNFDTGEVVKVLFDPNYELIDHDDRASVLVGSAYGTHLMQIPLGDGLVTIMSDNRFLNNPKNLELFGQVLELSYYDSSIALHDHAYYLSLLIGTDSKVWLLYGMETEGLMKLLWHNAQMACISVIALILVWLWWQRNRFGPAIQTIEPARRNLLEHIHMCANFAWKLDKGQQLFQTNREQFLHWLAKKHPQISQLNTEEQSLRLAELSNLSANKIHHALFDDWKTEREFIQLTYTLQTLRKLL